MGDRLEKVKNFGRFLEPKQSVLFGKSTKFRNLRKNYRMMKDFVIKFAILEHGCACGFSNSQNQADLDPLRMFCGSNIFNPNRAS